MARREDPSRPEDLPEGRKRRGEEPPEQPLSEEFVADAAIRKRALELRAELEQARAEEAAYEERHGMTFEEFQASFDPRTDPHLSEEYLEWARVAERLRMRRYELERLSQRGRRRRSVSGVDQDQESEALGKVRDEIERLSQRGRRRKPASGVDQDEELEVLGKVRDEIERTAERGWHAPRRTPSTAEADDEGKKRRRPT